MSAGAEGVRIDVWLFRARFVKSRARAAALVEPGHARLQRGDQLVRIARPAQIIRPGDILTLPLRSGPLRIEVLALGHRRGPPAEARLLWRDCDNAGP